MCSLGGGAEKKHRVAYLLTRVTIIVRPVRPCLSSSADSSFSPPPSPPLSCAKV